MSQQIKAIVFDWGGVLIDNPAPGLMRHCAQALGVSTEAYIAAHSRHGGLFQTGQIPEEEFWWRICADLNCPEPEVPSLWGQAFRAVYAPKEEVFSLAQRLRTHGYRTALLSNTEAPAMAYFHELRYDMFDALTFSCAEGTAKPGRPIFELTAGKLGLPCEQCVFIDDSPTYIAGAAEAKMEAILYTDPEQVCRALQDLGVTTS